ncbi:MAG: sialidase family protein [Gemmatimonadaceae bacterium]
MSGAVRGTARSTTAKDNPRPIRAALLLPLRNGYPPTMYLCSPARSGSAGAVVLRAGAALVIGAVTAIGTGCGHPPVEWTPERTLGPADRMVVVSAEGAIVPDTMAQLAARITAPPGPVCPGSLALARAGHRLFATWWAARPDSGARLLSAHTDDEGANWTSPAAVDTTDRGASGCRRSPPAIAADGASGYVHVAYAMDAREGPGLFFAHSMDAGASFHEPVPIFYGERLGRSSVAADGDVVAVAFEDPNSASPRIGLALSRTMGHIFEERLLPVSTDNGIAVRPSTAVRGRRIAVAWERRTASDSARAVLAVRAGVLR